MAFNLKKLFKSESIEPKLESTGPTLAIKLGDVRIASLFYDGENYCLTYTKAFRTSHLNPFNPMDFKENEMPVEDVVYKSKVLWQSFAARLPNPSRPDYEKAMKRFGLTGNENPLVILSKLGEVSISKPWKLELVK